MKPQELAERLHLENPILSFTRITYEGDPTKLKSGCTLNGAINRAMAGETIYVTAESSPCGGGGVGFGFKDGFPDIPGGFGNFISHGAGEGFRPGEKIKCNPKIAEAMLSCQPQNVMEGFDTVRIKPYEYNDDADVVAFIAEPDALSALIHLFNFRDPSYDNVIAPMTSGCASLFRIPFAEADTGSDRAVIGNVDLASRGYFDASSFIFVVSSGRFAAMLADSDDCFLDAPYWRKVEKRLGTRS